MLVASQRVTEPLCVPHRGYRNMGRQPYETFSEGKKLTPKTTKAKEVENQKSGLAAKRLKEGDCQGSG